MDYQDIEPILDRIDLVVAAIDRNTAQLERVEAVGLTIAMKERERQYTHIDPGSGTRSQAEHSTQELFRGWLAEIRKEKEADNA